MDLTGSREIAIIDPERFYEVISRSERPRSSLETQPGSESFCMIRVRKLLNKVSTKPRELHIDLMEQQGELGADEARRWKEGIYGLMRLWGLEVGDLLSLTNCTNETARRCGAIG